MGFGLIFVGYITLLFFKLPFAILAMTAGAYGMYKGLNALSEYGDRFKKAAGFAAMLCIYYGIYSALWILSSFGVLEGVFANSAFKIADSIIYAIVLLGFHTFMYGAFEDISRVCGYEKGIKKAYMSRVLMAMYFAFCVIDLVLLCIGKTNNYLLMAEYICQISWILYTAGYIYGCYRRIATQEIIDEEEKKIAAYDEKYGYKNLKRKTGKKK